MNDNFKRLADIARVHASLENMHENMAMKEFAKEVLLEENYVKFMKSYRFTFWFQLLGTLAGFIIPCAALLIVYKEWEYCAFGAAIGIFWMCIWMTISMIIPPTRIYRRFAKWFRKRNSSLDELDTIFRKER